MGLGFHKIARFRDIFSAWARLGLCKNQSVLTRAIGLAEAPRPSGDNQKALFRAWHSFNLGRRKQVFDLLYQGPACE